MNWQAAVNGLAVLGIVALGVAGKFGPPGTGDQIALGAIQILGGFIGGVGAAHLASREGSGSAAVAQADTHPTRAESA